MKIPVKKFRIGFPESYSKFPLSIYFAYVSVYISMLLSPFWGSMPTERGGLGWEGGLEGGDIYIPITDSC